MKKEPKKIRITWNGSLLREVYPHATRWQVFKWKARRFINRVVIVAAVLFGASALSAIAFAVGQNYTTKTVTISPTDAAYPVLERIAKCESNASQFDRSGQVLIHWNKNGTVDIGKYAVNETIWGAQATKLGLDLTKEDDNKAMALWIYMNRGTGDWVDSQNCWKR